MRALVVLMLLSTIARAEPERELCVRGAVYRGPAVDLDVKDADVHDVYRLLADVGRTNIVIADDVRARVTLRLKRVAWQQVACTIAAVHKLQILVDGNVLLVRRREAQRPAGG
jgi:type II secretory pathway component HofQ